jgi:hypothetical protein
MVDAFKILKSIMKNLKRLVIHLNLDEEHFRQNSITAISELMISALDAITGGEVDIKALIATSSKRIFLNSYQHSQGQTRSIFCVKVINANM